MTRRQFLIGTAAFLASLKFGLPEIEKYLLPDARDTTGPLLVEGLTFRERDADLCDVYYNNTFVMQANGIGGKILNLADGYRSIEDISGILAKSLGVPAESAEAFCGEVATFFVEVGEAGYLQNRVEVTLYENIVG